MFRGLILVEDVMAAEALGQLAEETRLVLVQRTANALPRPYELAQLLNVTDPEVVFLQIDGSPEAATAAKAIRERFARTAIVGVRASASPVMAPFPEEEIRAALTAPYTAEEFAAAVTDSVRAARPDPMRNLWAVMPAKAGSGASTVVLQTAACLERNFKKKVLVIEADLHSGVFADVLAIPPNRPVTEVLARGPWLEEAEWRRSMTPAHGIDFLLTDRKRRLPLPTWCEWFKLLEMAQSLYDVVLVDLPEVINDGTVEAVRRANKVWIVLTAELQSLALAKHRCKDLAVRGIPESRIELIVNRWHKTDAEPEVVEDLTGARVAAVVRNDYRTLKEATLDGHFVDRASDLGKGFADLAQRISRTPEVTPRPPERQGLLGKLGVRRG